MTKVRPSSLTIVAWLFIISGGFSAYDIISGLWQQRVSLNFGVLFIFIGGGLLKLRPAAHSWALAMVVLAWFILAVAVICSFCGLGTVRIGHEEVTGGHRYLAIIGIAVLFGTLLAWMSRVLTSRDVVELFHWPED